MKLRGDGFGRRAFVRALQRSGVLGLRFYVCAGCETVYAAAEEPPGCDCAAPQLSEITDRLQADTYFLPPEADQA